jgi:hypothetical protein
MTELDRKAQTGERPVLTPSPEYIQQLRDSLKANTGLSAPIKAQRAAAPRTQMSQIMTYYETLEAKRTKVITARADARRETEFSWSKQSISYNEYCTRDPRVQGSRDGGGEGCQGGGDDAEGKTDGCRTASSKVVA